MKFGIFTRIACVYLLLGSSIVFLFWKNKKLPEILVPAAALSTENDTHLYSQWMNRPEFNEFLKKQETEGKGKWAEAIEGKWENGYQKFRIAITKAPEGKPYQWLFSYDLDQKTFQAQLTENSSKGFQLVHSNKSTSPSGLDSYNAVWHKVD
jgi:hypothetical protein